MWWALCLPNWTFLMPSSTSLLEAKIDPFGAHLGTSSSQVDLWSTSTMWTSFFPLSCAALFNEYADALQYTMQINEVQDLLHYLDDYFTVGPPDSPVCANNIMTMIAMCEELSFTINSEKVIKPTTTTNFLRVDIDSVTMEAIIDPSPFSETISLLKDIVSWCSATKQTILSLMGKLCFLCHVCRPGRAFLHHMIEASVKAQHLHHRIKLNKEFCQDTDWWLQYLPTLNGVSLLHMSHWLSSVECKLFTDASDVGFSCYFQGH